MNQKDNIVDILAQLNRNRYPASVLRERPLPDGVNPLCLTDYLCEEEFEVICYFFQRVNNNNNNNNNVF